MWKSHLLNRFGVQIHCWFGDILFFQSHDLRIMVSWVLSTFGFNAKSTPPAGICLFKVNNGNTKNVWNLFKVNKNYTRVISTSFDVFIANFEQILPIVQKFPLLKQVNASWTLRATCCPYLVGITLVDMKLYRKISSKIINTSWLACGPNLLKTASKVTRH